MNSSDFLDVTLGNDRRKALLQRLLQQAGQHQSMGAALHAMPLFGGGRSRSSAELPAAPIPMLTTPFPIPPGLGSSLGPGSFGNPGQGEGSPGPGVPVGPPSGVPAPGGPVGIPAPPAPYTGMPSASTGSAVRRLFGGGGGSNLPMPTPAYNPVYRPLMRGI